MDNPPSKLVPALIGGCVMAILSNVPIVNMGNCLCCMWVILGGFIAAYLYQKDLPEGQPFNPGDGAIIGLLAGVFGALFGTLISVLFMAIGDFHPFNQITEMGMNAGWKRRGFTIHINSIGSSVMGLQLWRHHMLRISWKEDIVAVGVFQTNPVACHFFGAGNYMHRK